MIKITDFLNYKSVSDLNLSPNNDKLAMIVKKPDLSNNNYTAQLWIYNISTKSFKKILEKSNSINYLWLDNENILYIKSVDKDLSIIGKTNINSCENEDFFDIQLPINSICKYSDTEYFVSGIFENNTNNYPEELSFLEKEDDSFITIDELPFWTNGAGITNKKRNRLYYFNSQTKETKAITQALTNVDMFTIKNNNVLFIGRTYTDIKSSSSIFVYDINNETTNIIFYNEDYDISYVDFTEDKIIFAGRNTKSSLMTDNQKFYLLDENLVASSILNEDISINNSVLSDCKYGYNHSIRVFNNKIYFTSTEERGSFIKELSLNGKIRTLTDDIGSVEGFDICNDAIYFNGLRGNHLEEVYLLKSHNETQISDFNNDTINYNDINIPERFSFKNGGYNVNYVVIKPNNFDENKKYPAILYIHGGAKTLYSTVFFHEMQYLSSKGYFVIYGNPRGSDGQGSKFAKLQCEYGIHDYDDMMSAMDFALEKYPQIDKERLGVAGGSYGGILTNWIVGHTDRFKCACAQRSISNMITAFSVADNGFNFVKEQMGGDIWTGLENLWTQSPLKYACNVKTPLLLIHAEEDYRCHYVEAMQMFSALKYHGVDSKICLIKGENHDLSREGRPIQRIKRLYEISSWFDKYLM